tara:strand:+ start:4030 stop:4605 length:576 start_codon:yes stop_codon:yes gene_type:complete
MNLIKVLGIVALVSIIISCEPTEIYNTEFVPNEADTISAGFKVSMSINGMTTSFNSHGMGVSCSDSNMTFWGLATGNSVYYDSLVSNFQTTDPNDTMLAVIWNSTNSGTGTYAPLGLNSMNPEFSILQTPNSFVTYDASQLQIQITKVTPDSIYGSYNGSLNKVIFQNGIPYPTGQVDTLNATFAVMRMPC